MLSSFIHFLLVEVASAPARYGKRSQSNTKGVTEKVGTVAVTALTFQDLDVMGAVNPFSASRLVVRSRLEDPWFWKAHESKRYVDCETDTM
ncbi:hypothetical protein YC2023_015845 [Brassica napus]